ncbi:MAG: mandelate racemase [Verrucomicrobia bacterium]|nr:mandelate racemase [Verrucomicrobiota bacterium]
MLTRRSLLKGLVVAPWLLRAQEICAQASRGSAPLKIKDIKVIATSPRPYLRWVFIKVLTNEDGLYGLGSANCAYLSWAVKAALEKHFVPSWIGKEADRIEDLWQWNYVRSYWRNGPVTNVVQAALDSALWDIKGKRAGLPVYELLGGKARDAVPLYAHAGGASVQACLEGVQKYLAQGYRHVRVQLGGYGGGGFLPPGKGSRPETGFKGQAFDEELYVETISKLFLQLREKLGAEPKLLHDVHEHLTPSAALNLAKRLEPANMFFVEDILPPEQIDYFKQIRGVTTTPMAMGELFTHPHEWRPLIAERLIDFIRCRVGMIGGITQAKKIASLCEQFGVRTAWQEGSDNDPINQLIAYHVDLTIPSFGIQEENHFPEVVHEMMPGAAQIRGGYLYCSEKSGLGIDLNEEIAARFPMADDPKVSDWTTVRGVDGSLVKP